MRRITLSNGRWFNSQEAAKKHFRNILHAYPHGAVVNNPSHHSDLVALSERYDSIVTDQPHPKIGSGIKHFEIRFNIGPGYKTPSFWIVRTDGTSTDFSFYTAISGQPMPRSREFTDACRRAVTSQIEEFKRKEADENGQVYCAISGQLINTAEAHVDHYDPPFREIVWQFREMKGWKDDIPAGVLSLPQDAQTTTTFIEPSDILSFQVFHAGVAKLRILSAAEHRKLRRVTNG